MSNRTSKEDPKSQVRRVAETYRNVNGVVDMSKLRNEQPNIYSKISYHFGNITNFLVDMDTYKIPGKVNTSNFVSNREIIRNRMTWDRLQELRAKDGESMTFEEIALMYSKSKVYMARLYKDLEKIFANKNPDEIIDAEAGTTLNRGVIRNRLAWDRMNFLHSPNGENMTFEEIGLMYGKSASYMEMFYRDFERVFGNKSVRELAEAEVEFSEELI